MLNTSGVVSYYSHLQRLYPLAGHCKPMLRLSYTISGHVAPTLLRACGEPISSYLVAVCRSLLASTTLHCSFEGICSAGAFLM